VRPLPSPTEPIATQFDKAPSSRKLQRWLSMMSAIRSPVAGRLRKNGAIVVTIQIPC